MHVWEHCVLPKYHTLLFSSLIHLISQTVPQKRNTEILHCYSYIHGRRIVQRELHELFVHDDCGSSIFSLLLPQLIVIKASSLQQAGEMNYWQKSCITQRLHLPGMLVCLLSRKLGSWTPSSLSRPGKKGQFQSRHNYFNPQITAPLLNLLCVLKESGVSRVLR